MLIVSKVLTVSQLLVPLKIIPAQLIVKHVVEWQADDHPAGGVSIIETFLLLIRQSVDAIIAAEFNFLGDEQLSVLVVSGGVEVVLN